MQQYLDNRGRTALAASLIGVAAAGALIARRRRESTATQRSARSGVHIHEAVTINRPLPEVYQFWRNFENFPRFMRHLESVRSSGSRSLWRAKGPGIRTEWEAEIVVERENEMIAWRSLHGSDVQHSGSVLFEHAPGGRGTEVHVDLQYHPRAGVLGTMIARLFGQDPEQQIRHDLRRFKQLLETGEIPLSDGPAMWRPAQPPERVEDLEPEIGARR